MLRGEPILSFVCAVADPDTSLATARSPLVRQTEDSVNDGVSRPLPDHLAETLIQPSSGWPGPGLRELWKYRDLIFQLTLRNIKVRYKQTVLGVLWAVIQPLLMTVVFTLTFSQLLPNTAGVLPGRILTFAALLPWFFFQTAVTSAANSVVSSEGLVTKVYFPRLVIPLSAVLAALLDFAISFVVLVGMMAWYRIAPGVQIVLLPLAVGLVAMAAIGVGTLVAALTVSYRDFRHAVAYGLQIWMFATPTIYMSSGALNSGAGGVLQGWLSRLNPMTVPIDFFRATVLGLPIAWGSLAIAFVVHAVMFLVGIVYFRHVEDSFADVI